MRTSVFAHRHRPPRPRVRTIHRLIAACFGLVTLWPTSTFAQADPLLFLKRTKPNVLLVVDTRLHMQRDADGVFLDPNTYTRLGLGWESQIGIEFGVNTNQKYRRKYFTLGHSDDSLSSDRFTASSIAIVGDLEPGYSNFWSRTRLAVARTALTQAVQDNQNVVRFGLLRMRQSSPSWGTEKNEGPVVIDPSNTALQTPTETGNTGRWRITWPQVATVNGLLTSVQTPLVRPDASTANADVLTILSRGVGVSNALIPSGRDSKTALDAPVEYMLGDAKAEAQRLFAADSQYRNTVVVLVVAGGEGTTASSQNPAGKASQFLNISGHRVPIYVVALAPPSAHVSQLQSIAATSGGRYVEITKAMIDAVAPGVPVPELVRAVNLAVQHVFAAQTDFDAAPTAPLPYGPLTEFQVTSPIVGTVNLKNARDINGTPLVNTEVLAPSGAVLPQRSNVLLTTAFALPGFEARLRAFRMYEPVADATKPSGYRFQADGTPLWVAGVPAADSRNIFTVLPDGTVTPFTVGNASALSGYLNVPDPAALITYVRSRPINAPVGSTPAIMDPPSIDPPPDEDYPAFVLEHQNRRGIVWIGANDGMLHAIDSRLGIEVWAFIPFNLLPKLRAVLDDHAVGNVDYFVDSSPKVADVKIDGAWRTYLIVGQGPGGTFYQAFDVTLDDIAETVTPDDDNIANVLGYFSAADSVPFRWSFPSYSSFDPAIQPYGDVAATASALEKSVGESWSDPAVGQIKDQNGRFAVILGSGFLGYTRQQQANRGGTVAGTTFYLLDVRNGTVFDSRSVGSDNVAENVDSCATANDCTRMKNALQADPVATGPPDSRYVTKAYIGDLDGRVWRFDFSTDADGDPVMTSNPTKLFENGAAHPLFASMAAVNVGSTQQYIFYGTGLDLLPSNGVNQQYKLMGLLDQGAAAVQKFAILLARVDGLGDDEKVTSFPAVAGDIVFFTTSVFKPASPQLASDANLYAVTFVGGPAYDNTGDNKVTNSDTVKLKTLLAAGRATAPFIVDQHLVFGVGSKVEIFGDPQDYNNGVGQVGVRILSWREVR
jgi:hypothetical protein